MSYINSMLWRNELDDCFHVVEMWKPGNNNQ